MKKEKFMVIIMVVALILVPAQAAFAADPVDQTIVGEATVDYIDAAEKIDIVVPTSESLAFTLDPQNLAATQGVGEWAPEDGGSIIPAAVNIVANKSAVPIQMSVKLTLQDEANDVVLLSSSTDVSTGSDKNMYLSFVPAQSKTSLTAGEIAETTEPVFVQDGDNAATFAEADLVAAGVDEADLLETTAVATAAFGQFVETAATSAVYNQVVVPVHEAIAATTQTSVSAYATMGVPAAAATMADATVGANLVFALAEANYYVVKTADDFSLVYDGGATNTNYDTASFITSGVINENADWSGYDEDTQISLSATYSFDLLTKAEYDEVIESKLETTYNSLAYVAPVDPAVTDETFAIEADTAEDVAVTLGAGSSTATGITSVTYSDEGPQTLIADTDYTFSGTTLTFTEGYINSLIEDDVASRTFTVTFNDSDATTDTVTLTYTAPVEPVDPAITDETLAIEADTAKEVAVTLGAGSSAATGITSVTYSDGEPQTLTVDEDYTFSGTTLTFTEDYINSLIENEVSSRTYTVTFNNTGAKTDTVTLTYTPAPAAPSIATTSYQFTSGSPVEVTVDLGSGDLAATGIASITFLNASDAVTTLAASNYTFSDETLTFVSTYITSLASGGVTSRAFTITFNDTAATTVVVTLLMAE